MPRAAERSIDVHMITDHKNGIAKTKCGATTVMGSTTVWHTDVTCGDCLKEMNT